MNETEARAIVRGRSMGRCELAVRNICRGRAESAAHRQRRSQGGLWTPSNLLDACGSGTTGCHGWAGAHPRWAAQAGLEVPSWADPALVPAYIEWHGITRAWWHLTDDGSLTECQLLRHAPWVPDALAAGDCDGRCVRQLVRA